MAVDTLVGPESVSWCQAALRAAKEYGLEVEPYWIDGGNGITDSTGRFADVYGIGRAGAVLIRPDGFVAWRSNASFDHPGLVLEEALFPFLCGGTGTLLNPPLRRSSGRWRYSSKNASC